MIPKFKAYIPTVDLLLPVISIDFESKEVDCGNDDYGYDWCGYRFDKDVNGREPDCVLLQGTGRVDKDGTEIFEGDILKNYGGNFDSAVVFGNEQYEGPGFYVKEIDVIEGEEEPRTYSLDAFITPKGIVGNINCRKQ